jgi:pimeloyl-ACP methyl ester carboxylesterase
MKKFLRYSGFILSALVILVLAGFTIWAGNPAEPQPESTQSLDDTPEVKFTKLNDWLVFEPAGSTSATGLILYPGGRVDPRAYAPHAQAIAANGFSVIVVPMPLNFAFLGVNRASQVIDAFPEVTRWALGGHSLGGAMAADYVKNHPQKMDGLVLWAAYPAQNTDLSPLEIQEMSIFGANDGLATPEEVLSARPRLPVGTQFVEIPGGNHAGFGWYGQQRGDGVLEIPQSAQQSQIVAATVSLLSGLEKE